MRVDLQTASTVMCGVFLVVGLVLGQPWVGLSVVAGSYFALGAAYRSLVERSLDVNLLMVLAAAGSILVGHWADAAVLLFLFSLSSTLEARAMAKTRAAIERLLRLRPETAIRVVGDVETTAPVADLRPGDMIRVPPFELIPIDSTLVSDRVEVDEKSMTGEARPVTKVAGSPLLGGTQNLDSALLAQVTVTPGDTTLERIVTLVDQAQTHKASGEKISAWFGRRYTVFVLVAFGISLGVRLSLGQPGPDALYGALVLLVALSPCALVISTPAATLSALAFAARQGILVRGGLFIEEAGRVDLIAFDKTGTLTLGEPEVDSIVVCSRATCASGGSRDCDDEPLTWERGDAMTPEIARALAVAAAAERDSTHPIAAAIVRACQEAGVEPARVDSHRAEPGRGVIAIVEGLEVRIGQPAIHEELPVAVARAEATLADSGSSTVVMRSGEEWAVFGLRDQPRPEATRMIARLRSIPGVRLAILTGDQPQTATTIARGLGIDEVHARLMPADKARLIARWAEEGRRVMMIGDGINDAPALAQAHVGVAMGGLGSDVAMEAADVVLVQDRVERIPVLIELGRMTRGVIAVNLVFASGVIVALAAASLFYRLPLPVAVIGHEGSTVLVILNGLRLLRGPR
jgi:Cd2+/Zn2+-exporting ATPase